MLPEPEVSAEEVPLGLTLSQAIAQRYRESGAGQYGISPESFEQIVGAVVRRYGAETDESERLELVKALRVGELALARACSAGNERAWEVFLTRFRASLYETAARLARDDAAGRELADGLYAELYGISDRNGRKRSKLDYYMGRGSLEGWLRTVLSQQHVNRCRARAGDVSLDELMEKGVPFAGNPQQTAPETDDRVAWAVAETLAEVNSEERFLLASYYLDGRTLADIGRQLRVHESTVCRKLEKLTGRLRKRIRKRLQGAGIGHRRCEEILEEIDVRDLDVDVRRNLGQERAAQSFYK